MPYNQTQPKQLLSELMHQRLTATLDADTELPKDPSKLQIWLNSRLPALSSLINGAREVGQSIGGIYKVYVNTPSTLSDVLNGFGIVGLFFKALNFVRIPFAYLADVLNGNSPPPLSTGLKWFYSAVMLALAVTAIALPMVGLSIAIAATAIVIAESIFMGAKLLYEKYKLNKELKKNQEAAPNTNELENLRSQVIKLEKELQEAKFQNNEVLAAKIEYKLATIATAFDDEYQENAKDILTYNTNKNRCEKGLQERDGAAMANKLLGFVLPVVILTGIAIGSGAGAILLAAAAFIGFVYVGGSLVKNLINRKKDETSDKDTSELPESKEIDEEDVSPSYTKARALLDDLLDNIDVDVSSQPDSPQSFIPLSTSSDNEYSESDESLIRMTEQPSPAPVSESDEGEHVSPHQH